MTRCLGRLPFTRSTLASRTTDTTIEVDGRSRHRIGKAGLSRT
ncbi:MAG TPA: hypothetical protein VF728_08410 [Nocardioides sp.]